MNPSFQNYIEILIQEKNNRPVADFEGLSSRQLHTLLHCPFGKDSVIRLNKLEDSELGQLSPREIEILKLVAGGYSSTEIGQQLFISPRTVDTHRNNIIQKLQVNGVAGLVRFAIKAKLV